MSEPIIHLPGTFDERLGQRCIICGRILATSEYPGVEDDGSWAEGHMILLDADEALAYDTEKMTPEELKARWPNARTCQPGEQD